MTLIPLLKTISDPRSPQGRRHPLWLVLFLSLLGCLCGYWGYRPLADFAQAHPSAWCAWLEFDATQTQASSDSTFRQIFLTVDAQSWVDAFNLWALSHAPEYLGCLGSVCPIAAMLELIEDAINDRPLRPITGSCPFLLR